jgi:para-nitrobenzyl esterase
MVAILCTIVGFRKAFMHKLTPILGFAMILTKLDAAGKSPSPQVKTGAGVVEGKTEGKVHAFLGIPYAAPPVGNLRWRPPAPAANWTGVRKATEFGPRCMQGRVFEDMVFRDRGPSEDCLTLNVWAPAGARNLPVMVWIYGAGFVAGGTSEPRQDGQNLAKLGVVVVSMNYRLGILGFLALSQLSAESENNASGNYGLLDQVAALKWVQQNIAEFGGDPGNVTIFGESAGSFSVSAQMASPLAKGLFQKAIGESGGAFASHSLPFQRREEREQGDAKALEATVGVTSITGLRALTARTLLDGALKKVEGRTPVSFSPDVDGYFLPEPVPAIFAAGKQNDVALLAGWNRDERKFAVSGAEKPTAATLRATAEKEFGPQAEEFLELYTANSNAEALRSLEDFAGDGFIAFSTWKWMEAQKATGKQPVYRYRFDQSLPSAGMPDGLGAYHSAEIEYVFGTQDSKGYPWREGDRKLSELMEKYWTNFARSADPNGPGLPKWPAYAGDSGWEVMHLSARSGAKKDDLRPRYVFLDSVWRK